MTAPGHTRTDRALLRLLRRASAAATALLLVACMVGIQTREVAEIHVRCAEHGELMHVRAAAVVRTAGNGHTVLARSGARIPSGHDHCLFVGANHCMQAPLAAPAAMPVATVAEARAAPPVTHLTRATFRLAPKTSPPA